MADDTRTSGVRIQKSKREQLHVYYNEYKGTKLFNIRSFFFNDEDQDYRPSGKGITVSADIAEDLLEAIQKSINKQLKLTTSKAKK